MLVPDPDMRAKMAHKKKVQKFYVLKCWMLSPLGAEGFSCTFGVLYGGLGISKL
jgi:hypothetical protein